MAIFITAKFRVKKQKIIIINFVRIMEANNNKANDLRKKAAKTNNSNLKRDLIKKAKILESNKTVNK